MNSLVPPANVSPGFKPSSEVGEAHLFTCADDIAWLTATRANDYDYRRNVRACAIVTRDAAMLFTDLAPSEQRHFEHLRSEWQIIAQRSAWREAAKLLSQKGSVRTWVVASHHRPGAICREDMLSLCFAPSLRTTRDP